MVITGLERLTSHPDMLKGAGSLGLLFNQASVDTSFRPAPELLQQRFGGRLTTLFGPQHGVWCTEQDNMIETAHAVHPQLGLPIFSLYGERRRPDERMLANVDTALVDLQDVGTRVYTFATTVLYLMQACAAAGIPVIILDRPNPINGTDVEGNLLRPAYASFVGPFPLPMRHGMTLGELMTLYNVVHDIGCRLTVIEAAGWRRGQYYEETGLPWVPPSPNMPLVETAVVYPGQVVLEGTVLSEGRGTTRPFETFGAPFLEPARILEAVETVALAGAILRETAFRPTFNKWGGSVCFGFHLHVVDRRLFRPYRATSALLAAVLKLYPGQFRWTDPPYEYVEDKLPVDVILGDPAVREGLEAGRSILDMEREWESDLADFLAVRSRFLRYSE